MFLDFEVQRCTRRCAVAEREFRPGEWFYSVLVAEGANVIRRDYCAEAWTGPSDKCLGWWKSRLPLDTSTKPRLAPNDVLLELFDRWADELEKHDARYVLALLLVRRRVLRIEDEGGRGSCRAESLVPALGSAGASPPPSPPTQRLVNLYCPRRELSYQVAVVEPTPERIAEIQQELAELLYAGSI